MNRPRQDLRHAARRRQFPVSRIDHGGHSEHQAGCARFVSAKFPAEIERLLGFSPKVPAALAALDKLPEDFDRLPVDYDQFRQYMLCLRRGNRRFTTVPSNIQTIPDLFMFSQPCN